MMALAGADRGEAAYEIIATGGQFAIRVVAEDDAGVDRAIDDAWREAQRENERLFDAPLLAVEGILDREIRVRRTSYRHFVAGRAGVGRPVKPLAVSGFVREGSRLLIGRRPAGVTQYPCWWEAVPSGSIDRLGERGEADPVSALLAELEEETGIVAHRADLGDPALVFDRIEQVYDLCYEIAPRAGIDRMYAAARDRGHYTEVALLSFDEVRRRAENVVPTTLAIVGLHHRAQRG